MVAVKMRASIRRMVPAAVRGRLRRKSRIVGARNVDVVLDDRKQVKRWLRATPATYRIWVKEGLGSGPEAPFSFAGEDVNGSNPIIAVTARPLSKADRAALLQPLSEAEVAASVLG
ncbi:MAG: hypothetical protein V3U47_07725, partial [Acidimicrobiia bacterium]